MKKRFLCLGLSLLLVIGTVLSGCDLPGNNTEDEDGTDTTVNKNAITVTLAMSKGEGTTDEAAQMVEDALNVITEGKLNTHVELYLYDKSELKQAIVDKASEIGQLLKNGEQLAADNFDEEAEDTVIVDEETGRKTTQYPEVSKTQFDIILINGIEDYREYLDLPIFVDDEETTGLLAEITPSILLQQYVNATLLTTARDATMKSSDSSNVLAIPNNRDFGEYTYLVINKELADRYGYKSGDLTSHSVEGSATGFITSLGALEPFLSAVHNDNPDITLLANIPNKDTVFYTFDEGVPIGKSQLLGAKSTTMLEAPPTNLFGSDVFKAYYRVMWQLAQWGQRPTAEVADLNGNFAVAYVKGNATTIADIDTNKYYVEVCDAPVKNNDVVYSSMYGVTKYSVNAARAAEVVELFNTNKKFRNLMYYGIQDVHYMVDDNGEYIKLNNDWNMDIYDTGNLYLLERSRDLGDYYYTMSENTWEAGKALNRDSVNGLLLGFSYIADDKTKAAIESLRTKYTAWNESLLNYTGTNITSAISDVKTQIDLSDEFKVITDASESSNSIYYQYIAWYGTMAPAKG